LTRRRFIEDTDTTGATQSLGDPRLCADGGGPTVWYRVTPSFTGRMCVSSCGGTAYFTSIAAFAGTCETPGAWLACNDEYCRNAVGTRITVDVESGVDRLVAIGRYFAMLP
jgi:hypothetical protein